MSEPFLAEIRMVSFDSPPRNWASCNGQLLPINQNQALFALLGTTYGGNGVTTFALPDMRDRIPVHTAEDLPPGQRGGLPTVTLSLSEVPLHTHQALARRTADSTTAGGSTWASAPAPAYGPPASSVPMATSAVEPVGGAVQPHENRPPTLVVHFVIALQGIFPSRN